MADRRLSVRKVSGAVLMMVVTIMFVLVIMLLATLTVVSNTSKRTVSKFEENQAYYTARSMVEVYIDEILESEEKTTETSSVIAAWKNMGFTFDAKTDGSTNERLAQLEAHTDFTGNEVLKGFVNQQEIFGYLTPKYMVDVTNIVDSTTGKVADGKSVKSNDAWVKNTSASEDAYTMVYEATLPKLDGKTVDGRDAGILADGADSDGGGKVSVRLELLRLVYFSTDGVFLYDGQNKAATSLDSGKDDADKIYDGTDMKMSKVDLDNIYFRLKVSATASIANKTGGYSERTVSVMLEPGDSPRSPSPDRDAINASNGSSNSDNLEVFGGMTLCAPDRTSTAVVANDSSWVGNLVVLGYKEAGSSVQRNNWVMSYNEYNFIPDGFFSLTNKNNYLVGRGKVKETNVDKRSARPFLYAKGLYLPSAGDTVIGSDRKGKPGSIDDAQACDLILVGNPDLADKAGLNVDSIKTLVEAMKNAGEAVGNVPTKDRCAYYDGIGGSEETHVYGDTYIDGDMYILNANSGRYFHGDTYITGNIILGPNCESMINSMFESTATVKLGGRVYSYNQWSSPPSLKVLTPPSNVTVSLGEATGGEAWAKATGADCKFNVYGNVAVGGGEGSAGVIDKDYLSHKDSKNKDKVSGAQYVRGLVLELPNGVTKKISTMPGDDNFGGYNASTQEYENYDAKTAFQKQSQMSDAKLNGGGPTLKSCVETKSFELLSDPSDPSSPKVTKTFNNVIVPPDPSGDATNNFCFMKLTSADKGSYYIDATSGAAIQITIDSVSNTDEFEFIVIGDTPVYFTMPDDKGSMTVYKMKIVSYDINELITKGSTYYIGSNADNDTPENTHAMTEAHGPRLPQIYIFVGKNNTFGWGSRAGQFISGVLDAPEAKIECYACQVGLDGATLPTIVYDRYPDFAPSGTAIQPKNGDKSVQFGGSIICDNIYTQNKFGVIKFRSNAGGASGGTKKTAMITWKRQRYLNR